jgi:hypothetical protein
MNADQEENHGERGTAEAAEGAEKNQEYRTQIKADER